MLIKSIKKEILYPVIFLILAILFFFSNITFSYLQMGDVILWEIENIKNAIFNHTPYFWNNAYFATSAPSTVSLHPRTILIALFPYKIYPQISIIFHIFIMGYGSFLFIRLKKLELPACFFGAIALMFSNAIVTLILPGHLGKFETYCYFPFVLYFLSKAMYSEKWFYFLCTAAFLGISFLGGALDVAMYFSLFLGCYFLCLLYLKKGEYKLSSFIKREYKKIITLCIKFLFVAVFSFLMSIQIIMITKNTQDMGAAGVQNKKELWQWATRWSFPPEEMLGFFIPGFFGYYSGSETHPYWGRTANMPGEPKTSNYSLTAVNIGVVTFIFILFAFFLKQKKYKEKYFWIGASLFFLIAGFGRYFPIIYGILFQIPIFRDARNPNKFIEIIPIPLTVLAAFGADYIFKAIKAKKDDKLINFFENNGYKYVSIIEKSVYILTILSLIAALITLLANSSVYNSFLPNWKAPQSTLIAKNISMSFIRLTLLLITISILIKNALSLKELKQSDKYIPILPFMCFVIFGVYDLNNIGFLILGSLLALAYIILVSKDKIFYKSLPYAFIAVVFLDLIQSGSIFIVKSNIDEMYNSTPIVENILKENGNETTMPILIPYLYRYTTHTMPYYKIPLTEPPAASRLSKDITDTFRVFRINDYIGYQPRLMDLLGVRYILSPTYLDNSMLSNDLTKIIEYQDEFSAAVLYELKGYRKRFEYANNIYTVKDFAEALINITKAEYNLSTDVVLYETSNIEPSVKTFKGKEANYEASITSETQNKIELHIISDEPGVLVLKEKYDDNWSVFVDGMKKNLLKANIMFRGVYLEPGEHNVIFEFTPSMEYFYITLSCWIIFLIAVIIKISFYIKKVIINIK